MNYFNQESERLRFRKLTEADIPAWITFFDNNDRLSFLGMDLSKSKEALAEGWIRAQFDRYKNSGIGHLAAELKETGEFIGLGGILPRELEGKQEYEIAYSLLPKFWKKGYGTELAQTMTAFGIQHISPERFISIIHINNHASIRVAEKNRMKVLFRTDYLGMTVDVYGLEL